MAKYNQEMVNRICSLIEKDSYTIAEICQIVGIAESRYYEWKDKKEEFQEAIKKAQDKWDESLVKDAKNSLKRLINGYSTEETKVILKPSKKVDAEGKPIPEIKEQIKITKHVQPNLGAVIFALTNKASDDWRNRQNTEISGSVSIPILNIDPLSDESDNSTS